MDDRFALLQEVVWEPIPGASGVEDGLPYATHRGTLEFLGSSLTVYMLNTGERVIAEDDVVALFGRLADRAS